MRDGLDFFISYTRADERWAEWIAEDLEEEGYTTKIQTWDFRPGMNFAAEMQKAATEAEHTLAVLSPAYIESEFGTSEWIAAFVQDPTGRDAKLLPVRVANFKPPGLLASIVYIDLWGKTKLEARTELRRGIQRGRAKRRSATFPGPSGISAPSKRDRKPPFPGDLPSIWTLTLPHNPHFEGRTAELESVRTALHQNATAALTQPRAIHDLGGVGKTQLAVEYAWRSRAEYDAVLWVDADTPASLRANLAALAGNAGLALPEREAKEEATRLDAVVGWLRTHERWLLIFDNVDTPEAQEATLALLPTPALGHVLLTSRRTDWPLPIQTFPIDVLPEGEAAKFLLSRTHRTAKRAAQNDDPDAVLVARELGGLPLALEQAAAYIAKHRLRCGDYLARLKEAPTPLLKDAASGGTGLKGGKTAVATTWSITERELGTFARTLLRLISFFAPEDIPRDLFAKGPAIFSEALERMVAESGGTNEAQHDPTIESGLVELADYSLITLGPTAFSCHRLLMAVQQECIATEARSAWLQLASNAVGAAAPPEPEDVRSRPAWDALRPHVAALVNQCDQGEITRP